MLHGPQFDAVEKERDSWTATYRKATPRGRKQTYKTEDMVTS